MTEVRDEPTANPPDVPGYRIARRLGQGGMAEVFLAVQLSLQRPVALKVLDFEQSVSPEMAERFEREARTIARLDHPHIVGIYEVGRTSSGSLYYAMPFLPNGDLSQRDLREDANKVLEVLRSVCEALKYAHAHGVVHRDVKPANILFDKTDRPLLTDFGIALSRDHDSRVTTGKRTLGSTGYMSPEQARGHDIDGRADLYSLGVVCYELLTSELPFHGADPLSVAIAHMEDPVPRLPANKRAWQPLIDKALAKRPDDRFQNAGEMLVALDEVEYDLAHPPPPPLPLNLPPRPPRAAWLAVGGAALVALTYGLTQWSMSHEREVEAAEIAAAAARADPATVTLREAQALLAQGALVEPAVANAAAKFLDLLKSDPRNVAARSGLDAVVVAMGERSTTALRQGRGDEAAKLYEQTYALAQWSAIPDYPAFAQYDAAFRTAVGDALERALAAKDRARLAALDPVIEIAARSDPAVRQRRRSLDATPVAGARLRDANGPLLAFVPAHYAGATLDHAYALSAHEVTRGEYAAFQRATGRRAGVCRDLPGPLALLRDRSWREPGYAQNDEHPAVCITWEDAQAYTLWLSARTGQRYRLPTLAEWRHAARELGAGGNVCRVGNVLDRSSGARMGDPYDCSDGFKDTAPVGRFTGASLGVADLAGNVREWLDDCTARSSRGCGERMVVGTSYRDGQKVSLLGPTDSRDIDQGAPWLGFRVVREIAGTTWPPPADR